MKKILITSAGFLRKSVRDEIVRIVPPGQYPDIIYIPTASRVVKDDSYAQKDVEWMQQLGYQVQEVDLADFAGRPAELEPELRKGSALYVQGGNPYWLLKTARESGFLELAPKLIEEGMPYIGKSAGAYLLGPEVVPPTWYDKEWRTFGVTDLKAMGVVPFIWAAHYDPADSSMREAVARGAATSPYPVRAITNDQALLVADDSVELLGPGEEFVIQREGNPEDPELHPSSFRPQ